MAFKLLKEGSDQPRYMPVNLFLWYEKVGDISYVVPSAWKVQYNNILRLFK